MIILLQKEFISKELIRKVHREQAKRNTKTIGKVLANSGARLVEDVGSAGTRAVKKLLPNKRELAASGKKYGKRMFERSLKAEGLSSELTDITGNGVDAVEGIISRAKKGGFTSRRQAAKELTKEGLKSTREFKLLDTVAKDTKADKFKKLYLNGAEGRALRKRWRGVNKGKSLAFATTRDAAKGAGKVTLDLMDPISSSIQSTAERVQRIAKSTGSDGVRYLQKIQDRPLNVIGDGLEVARESAPLLAAGGLMIAPGYMAALGGKLAGGMASAAAGHGALLQGVASVGGKTATSLGNAFTLGGRWTGVGLGNFRLQANNKYCRGIALDGIVNKVGDKVYKARPMIPAGMSKSEAITYLKNHGILKPKSVEIKSLMNGTTAAQGKLVPFKDALNYKDAKRLADTIDARKARRAAKTDSILNGIVEGYGKGMYKVGHAAGKVKSAFTLPRITTKPAAATKPLTIFRRKPVAPTPALTPAIA